MSEFGLELAVIGFSVAVTPPFLPVPPVAVFSLVGGRCFSSSAAASAASMISYSVKSLNEVTSYTFASLESLKIDFMPIWMFYRLFSVKISFNALKPSMSVSMNGSSIYVSNGWS